MAYPVEWAKTLNKLRSTGTSGVIAGGAVRDFLLGRPVKDIDVFLKSRGKEEDAETVKKAFPDAVAAAQHLDEYLPQFAEVSSIWNAGIETEKLIFDLYTETVPVQLIFLNVSHVSVYSVMERIDFGLCRVAYDGKQLYMTDEFVYDLARQQMTIRRDDLTAEGLARSNRRYTRLTEKYPTYTFCNPFGPFA